MLRENETSAAKNDKETNMEKRSAFLQNLLSEAMMYYATNRQEQGDQQIKRALHCGNAVGEKILPQEIVYITSGGQGTPTETTTEAGTPQTENNTDEKKVKNLIDEVHKKMSKASETEKETKMANKPLNESREQQNESLRAIQNLIAIIQLRIKLLQLKKKISSLAA